MRLEQVSLIVVEYKAHFFKLVRYDNYFLTFEYERVFFGRGLRLLIHMFMKSLVITGRPFNKKSDYTQVVKVMQA